MIRPVASAAVAVVVFAFGALLGADNASATSPAVGVVSSIRYKSEADCEAYEGKGKCSKCPIAKGDPGWHTSSSCGTIAKLPARSAELDLMVKQLNSAEESKIAVHLKVKKTCDADVGTWTEQEGNAGCWLKRKAGGTAPSGGQVIYKRQCVERHGEWKEKPKGEWGCWFAVK